MVKLYKDEVSLSTRISESNRILAKYIDKIPVIIDCDKELDAVVKKRKFLVPRDVSASYLISLIRSKLNLNSKKAIFIFCNNTLIHGQTIIGEIYDKYIEDLMFTQTFEGDRFLYFYLSCENTFG
jgi:GABA(A) receptor-associated protein